MYAIRSYYDQELVLLEVAHHGIRPVQHRGLEEGDRLCAGRQRVTGLDDLELPPRRIKEPVQPLLAAVGNVDRRPGRQLHDPVEARHMVVLDVIDDDVLDLGRIDQAADVLDRILREIVLA